jgi:3',5'-cyclic AMP phosphodiesterase CpdA
MYMISFRSGMPLFLAVVLLYSCNMATLSEKKEDTNRFSFAFLTDIHLQPELNAPAGFRKAIEVVDSLQPDFVITGGDLIMDALGQGYARADSLYDLYDSMQRLFTMPVYNTMGNHEIFGIYDKSGVGLDHPEYGQRMYESRLGPSFYSFDHKGWHFMVLDGIEDTGENGYIGLIDSAQMEWIRADLEVIHPDTPIAVSIHIPFITVVTQLEQGALVPNGRGTVVNNAREVLALFKGHNLRLVLQGHLHYLEEIRVGNTTFITGGAVSSRWWGGRYRGLEEGFVLVEVNGDDFTWEYIDYGWEAEEVTSW